MSKLARYFFLTLAINFVVLAGLSVLFEYFDTGDDPIYSTREAIKNFVMALCIAGTIVFINRSRNTWRISVGAGESSPCSYSHL